MLPRLALLLLALWMGTACSTAAPAPARPAQPAPTCALADADRLWIQEALGLWQFASERLLLLEDRPLPWMIFFDARCAFHLGPDRRADPRVEEQPVAVVRAGARDVPIHARPHEGGLVLPDGERRPVAPMAFASVYRREQQSFSYFVLALMSVWSTHPKVKHGTSVSERILTVAVHELAHTHQLVPLQARIRALPAVPAALDDDVVQRAFGGNAAYEEAYFAERDLLFRAAASTDAGERKKLAREALARMRARHARFFAGEHAVLAALEPLFLHLEGVGEWVRVRLIEESRRLPDRPELRRADALFDGYDEFRRMSTADALLFVRGVDNDWVQDHGLALFMLIDRLAPGWQKQAFSGELVSPYVLLEEALAK